MSQNTGTAAMIKGQPLKFSGVIIQAARDIKLSRAKN